MHIDCLRKIHLAQSVEFGNESKTSLRLVFGRHCLPYMESPTSGGTKREIDIRR